MAVNAKNWQELKKPNALERKSGGDARRATSSERSGFTTPRYYGYIVPRVVRAGDFGVVRPDDHEDLYSVPRSFARTATTAAAAANVRATTPDAGRRATRRVT